jgi:hypothetical protein
MSEDERRRNQGNTKRDLPRLDDYSFDGASGLYKPKSSVTEERGQYDDQGRLRVSVARDRIAIWIASITLAIVAAYTYYSMRTVEVMKEGAERPQVLLGEDSVTTKPAEFTLVLRGGGGITGLQKGTEMGVAFPLTINNVGKKLATRYSVFGDLIAETQDTDIGNMPVDGWWRQACGYARGNMEGPRAPSQTPLFPGVIKITAGAGTLFPDKPQHIRRIFAVSCVAYREINGDEHFTAIMYCSGTGDHPIKVSRDPDIFFDLGESTLSACQRITDQEAN